MPIELGLGRISRLLANVQPFTWKAIHVAGTNGKGSVCRAVSVLLRASGLTAGQFSTPHIEDRWDAIHIHGLPIAKQRYDAISKGLEELNSREAINATEFELLTAAAFRAFSEYKVDVGVVEVGLGGRLDATNILEDPLVTVITKIGMDHQALLGNTLEEIAVEKAGIMKPGVPCLIDASNPQPLHDLFLAHAEDVGAGPVKFVDPTAEEFSSWKGFFTDHELKRMAPHQLNNVALARAAASVAWQHFEIDPDLFRFAAVLRQAPLYPNQLHVASLFQLTERGRPVLLDGAHNPQAAAALGAWVDKHLRKPEFPVHWLMAISDSKDVKAILKEILRPGDTFTAAEFGPVDSMPWAKSYPAKRLLEDAQATTSLRMGAAPGRRGWLETGTAIAGPGPLVIGGSLYLLSELNRDRRSLEVDPSRALPPNTKSWRVQRGKRWFEVPRALTGYAISRYVWDKAREEEPESGPSRMRPMTRRKRRF